MVQSNGHATKARTSKPSGLSAAQQTPDSKAHRVAADISLRVQALEPPSSKEDPVSRLPSSQTPSAPPPEPTARAKRRRKPPSQKNAREPTGRRPRPDRR